MSTLDETDLEILSLLAENARRPFSEIGEEVGLSGPAVSDRVTRLQEAGVLNNFTIEVDRAQLRAGLPVLIQLSVPPEYSVTLIDEAEWTPSIEGVEFALTCAECGNTVDSEGETTRIDGETYHFCCPSCLSRFEERYRRLEEGT